MQETSSLHTANNKGLSVGAISGIAAGSVALLLLQIGIITLLVIQKRRKKNQNQVIEAYAVPPTIEEPQRDPFVYDLTTVSAVPVPTEPKEQERPHFKDQSRSIFIF